MSRSSVALTVAAVLAGSPALAEPPKVVTDILPVHSLVSAVMEGVSTPTVLVEGAASPHGLALRPSQAAALQDADLVVWVGEELTPQFDRAIDALADPARSLVLLDVDGITTLEFREGALFEHDHGDGDHGHEGHAYGEHDHDEHAHGDKDAHAHGEHDHEEHARGDKDAHAHGEHDHEEHAHGDRDAHAHGEHDHEEHAHDGHGHDHDGVDPHAWLDPENAKVWLTVIAERLAALDPENAATYRDNAANGAAAVDAAAADVRTTLAPVGGAAFLVFHDAYHYFEHHFGVEAAGAISLGDAAEPSAARLAEIRDFLEDSGAQCIFAEPHFNPNLAEVVAQGAGARVGMLDPLGSALELGPDAYPDLLRTMAISLAECLAAES